MKIGLFLIGILVMIEGCSIDPAKGTDQKISIEDSTSISKKKEINDFWSFYRSATKSRIDGKWAEAIAAYKKALDLNGVHTDALYYLGNMHLELKEYAKAEESWYNLLATDSSSSRAYYQLGKLYLNADAESFFDPDKAAIKFRETIAINKDFLQPVLHLAQISLIKEDYQDTRKKLNVVLGSDEHNIEALFLTGFVNFKKGDLENALLFFSKARTLAVSKRQVSEVKGEGDTKTGESLERAINQSIFMSYFMNFTSESDEEIQAEMQLRFAQLNDFIERLQNL